MTNKHTIGLDAYPIKYEWVDLEDGKGTYYRLKNSNILDELAQLKAKADLADELLASLKKSYILLKEAKYKGPTVDEAYSLIQKAEAICQ